MSKVCVVNTNNQYIQLNLQGFSPFKSNSMREKILVNEELTEIYNTYLISPETVSKVKILAERESSGATIA